MSRYLLLIFLLVFNHPNLFACDFSVGVKRNSSGDYVYSKECHLEVGRTLERVNLLQEKLDLTNKQIELKDLMISRQETRTQMWIETSMDMHKKLTSYEVTQKNDGWIQFGLGVGVTILSVWAAGQIAR